uniref:Sushi domain-containing protein n=1 Tax=Loxodonta africana TaxID=9785 RepID=G3ULU5_LOXAF
MLFVINVLLTLWVSCAEGQVKPCDFPEIKNGYLHYQDYYRPYFPVELGKYYYYYCNSGFVTPEERSGGYITCRREGWSPSVPCLKRCHLYDVENGYSHYSGRYRLEGRSVDVQCNHGYSLPNGHSTITCTEHGWSPPPKCIRVKNILCSPPPSIENGTIKSSRFSEKSKESKPGLYPHGTKLTYVCEDGFKLSKEDGITCHMRKWSSPPQCVGLPCEPPPLIDHGVLSHELDSYQHGEEVTYNCTDGFGIDGPESIKCLGGKWPTPLECRNSEGKCGFPPPIENGDITSFPLPTYAQGSTAEYQCQAFCELQGDKHITCRNGQWSEAPKCLEACVVSEEMMEMHNIKLKWKYDKGIYSKTSDTVEFTCKWGYTAKTPRATFRARCQEGKLEYPSCE